MYTVYFEKLGQRGRKSGSTRLSVEMPGGGGWEGKNAGVATESYRKKER